MEDLWAETLMENIAMAEATINNVLARSGMTPQSKVRSGTATKYPPPNKSNKKHHKQNDHAISHPKKTVDAKSIEKDYNRLKYRAAIKPDSYKSYASTSSIYSVGSDVSNPESTSKINDYQMSTFQTDEDAFEDVETVDISINVDDLVISEDEEDQTRNAFEAIQNMPTTPQPPKTVSTPKKPVFTVPRPPSAPTALRPTPSKPGNNTPQKPLTIALPAPQEPKPSFTSPRKPPIPSKFASSSSSAKEKVQKEHDGISLNALGATVTMLKPSANAPSSSSTPSPTHTTNQTTSPSSKTAATGAITPHGPFPGAVEVDLAVILTVLLEKIKARHAANPMKYQVSQSDTGEKMLQPRETTSYTLDNNTPLLQYAHFYDDWTSTELILDALDLEYDELPDNINELFHSLTTVNMQNITRHYEDALHCLLILHTDLRCPRKQHHLFWQAHNYVSVPNLVSLISRLSLLQKSRSILVCLLRTLAGMATMQDRWIWNFATLHYPTNNESAANSSNPMSSSGRGGGRGNKPSGYSIEELHQSLRQIEEQLNAIDLLDEEQAREDAQHLQSSPSQNQRKSYLSQYKAEHAKEQFLGPSTRQIRESARRTMMMGKGPSGGSAIFHPNRTMLVYGAGNGNTNPPSHVPTNESSYQTFLTEDPESSGNSSPLGSPTIVANQTFFPSPPRGTTFVSSFANPQAPIEAGKIDIRSVLANTQASLRRTMRLQVQNIVANANANASIIASSTSSSSSNPSTSSSNEIGNTSPKNNSSLKPSEIMKRESVRRHNGQGKRDSQMTTLLEEEEEEEDEDEEDDEEEDDDEDNDEEDDDEDKVEEEEECEENDVKEGNEDMPQEEVHQQIILPNRVSTRQSLIAPTNSLRASVIAKLQESRQSARKSTIETVSTSTVATSSTSQSTTINHDVKDDNNTDLSAQQHAIPPRRSRQTSLLIATEAAATATLIDNLEAQAEAEEAKHAAEDLDSFEEASPEVIQSLLKLWLSSIPWNVDKFIFAGKNYLLKK